MSITFSEVKQTRYFPTKIQIKITDNKHQGLEQFGTALKMINGWWWWVGVEGNFNVLLWSASVPHFVLFSSIYKRLVLESVFDFQAVRNVCPSVSQSVSSDDYKKVNAT